MFAHTVFHVCCWKTVNFLIWTRLAEFFSVRCTGERAHKTQNFKAHNQRIENVIVEPTRSTQHYESSGALAGQICGHWSCRSHEIVRSIIASCVLHIVLNSRTDLAVLCFAFPANFFVSFFFLLLSHPTANGQSINTVIATRPTLVTIQRCVSLPWPRTNPLPEHGTTLSKR